MELNELFTCKDKSFELQGHTFKFRDVTIEDENSNWELYYPKGKYNPAMYETFRLCLFTETPFSREFINSNCNIDKEWNEMSMTERFKFVSTLKSEGIKELKAKLVETNKSKEVDEIVGN